MKYIWIMLFSWMNRQNTVHPTSLGNQYYPVQRRFHGHSGMPIEYKQPVLDLVFLPRTTSCSKWRKGTYEMFSKCYSINNNSHYCMVLTRWAIPMPARSHTSERFNKRISKEVLDFYSAYFFYLFTILRLKREYWVFIFSIDFSVNKKRVNICKFILKKRSIKLFCMLLWIWFNWISNISIRSSRMDFSLFTGAGAVWLGFDLNHIL